MTSGKTGTGTYQDIEHSIAEEEKAQIITSGKGVQAEDLTKMNCACRFIKDMITEDP
jgi:DNA-binding cell septation regulator SpoVG